MMHSNSKHTQMQAPGAIASATNTGALDTLGADYATITASFGTLSAAFTVMKLQESDDNSAWSDVAGDFAGNFASTEDGQAAALPDTGDKLLVWYVDTRALKRYLRVAMTPGASSPVSVTGETHEHAVGPLTAADRNVTGFRFVQKS